jgi:hypothetical protein
LLSDFLFEDEEFLLDLSVLEKDLEQLKKEKESPSKSKIEKKE